MTRQKHKHEIEFGHESATWLNIKYDDRQRGLVVDVRGNVDELHGLQARIFVHNLCKRYDRAYNNWCGAPNPGQEPRLWFDDNHPSIETSHKALDALRRHVDIDEDYDPDDDPDDTYREDGA